MNTINETSVTWWKYHFFDQLVRFWQFRIAAIDFPWCFGYHNHKTFVLEIMKALTALALLLALGCSDLMAQELPQHCQVDSRYKQQLQSMGPIAAVGASVTSGLAATPFPTLIARQMCLQEGDGFEARYSFLFFGAKLSFLQEMYTEQRPKVVLALDHLHHSSKSKSFDALTREYVDRELARISIDCRHPVVDCSAQGLYHFSPQESYKPIVLLGDVYAFYAVDCSSVDPYQDSRKNDRMRNSVESRQRGCIDDYIKINQYIWQKASEINNLHVLPVDRFFRNLHHGLPYLYDLDGKLGNFYADDLFWDNFHPWSEPGSQIIANLVLEKLNALILNGLFPGAIPIPYIPIGNEFLKPFTGIALIKDEKMDIPPDEERRFVSEQGEAFVFDFADQTGTFRRTHGDWGYPEVFARNADSLRERAGDNPLVLKITTLTTTGDIVLSDQQISLIKRVSANPENQILGGVITVANSQLLK